MKKKRRENKLKNYNENYNTHHLINRCRGWTSVEENTRETKVRLHNCLHALFWNETPAEAIKSLIDYFEPALMEWFKNDLLKVLRDWKWVEHKTKTYSIFTSVIYKNDVFIDDIFDFIDLVEILKAFSSNKLNPDKKYKFNNFDAKLTKQ